jgi:hypothetical protein
MTASDLFRRGSNHHVDEPRSVVTDGIRPAWCRTSSTRCAETNTATGPAALTNPRATDVDFDRHAALIYAIDTPGAGPASRLRDFVAARAWSLVEICLDIDATTHPALRPGLGTALERLHSGVATALVLDEDTYEAMPDCLWLKVAVQNSGGVLRLARVEVGAEASAALETRGRTIGAVAAFRGAGSPFGACPKDVG